jgi:hypothetical protein
VIVTQRRLIADEIFVRPGRTTPRPSPGHLAELKRLAQFNFTEDGIPIGPSVDDKLDEAYENGVRARLAQSYRRGFQQRAHVVYCAIEKTGLLDRPTQKKLRALVFDVVEPFLSKQLKIKRHTLQKKRRPMKAAVKF